MRGETSMWAHLVLLCVRSVFLQSECCFVTGERTVMHLCVCGLVIWCFFSHHLWSNFIYFWVWCIVLPLPSLFHLCHSLPWWLWAQISPVFYGATFLPFLHECTLYSICCSCILWFCPITVSLLFPFCLFSSLALCYPSVSSPWSYICRQLICNFMYQNSWEKKIIANILQSGHKSLLITLSQTQFNYQYSTVQHAG